MNIKNFKIVSFLIFLALLSCGRQNGKDKKVETNTPLSDTALNDTVPILGIDVSHYQGDVNWNEIKEAGISFMYTKASQGTEFKDSRFKENWDGAKKAGIYRGAYHFYVSGEDPIKQAENFLQQIGQFEKSEIPPVLDLEELSIKNSPDIQIFQKNVLKWLKTIKDSLNVKPIIYTDPSFGDKYLNNKKFSDYKLWIAEYGVKEPRLPKAWEGKDWTIWQRTSRGSIEGAVGNVDHDLFNGFKKEFEKDFLKK